LLILVYQDAHNCKKMNREIKDVLLQEPRMFELHVKPTYAVLLPQRSRGRGGRTEKQRENEINLRANSRRSGMSPKATRRLNNAINWLIAAAPVQWFKPNENAKKIPFRVNFITLTLPTTEHVLSDHHFKSKLLHAFINSASASCGLKNYVWKVEAQDNGNIHAHIVTDVFIHWRRLRTMWNNVLRTHGILALYTEKFEGMSFTDYRKLAKSQGATCNTSIARAFAYGKKTGWKDPNTTDVHAVAKVEDVAAYLASYMSKKEEGKREITGRLWACSRNLSDKNNLSIEMMEGFDNDLLTDLREAGVKEKPLENINPFTLEKTRIGTLFLYAISDWRGKIGGRLLQFYNDHIRNIREGSRLVDLFSSNANTDSQPQFIIVL